MTSERTIVDKSNYIFFERRMKQLSALVEATSDFAAVADSRGNALYINKGGRELVGIPLGKDIGKTVITDYYPGKEKKKMVEEALPIAKEKGIWSGETIFLTQDKKEIPVSEVIIYHQGESDSDSFYATIVRDISQQKKTKLELEEKILEIQVRSEKMERQAKAMVNLVEDLNIEKANVEEAKVKDEAYLDSIGDGVVIINKDGNVVKANQPAMNILGRNDLVGRNFSQEVDYVDKNGKKVPLEKRPINSVLKNGKKETILDHSYLRNDGVQVPVSLTTAPVIFNKKIIGAVDVFRDATREREIDKAKTEFVSLASHQLRTPLSAINWYTEMLLAGDAGKINSNQKRYLEEIYKGNQRMVDLVNALLDVSRIELGTFAIEPEMTDIKEISRDVVKEIQGQIKKKNLAVVQNYDKKLPKINVDPKLARIILQNIISNAVKYTSEKGKVAISFTMKDPDVLIKVVDTGYGIPKEQQSHIFEKLFRADNVRERDAEGTGLGLYLVKAIVDQSGGKVWFESFENKGTTFFVTIPLSGMKKKEGTKALEDIK